MEIQASFSHQKRFNSLRIARTRQFNQNTVSADFSNGRFGNFKRVHAVVNDIHRIHNGIVARRHLLARALDYDRAVLEVGGDGEVEALDLFEVGVDRALGAHGDLMGALGDELLLHRGERRDRALRHAPFEEAAVLARGGLEVDHVDGTDIYCTITNGGELGEHKGVNFPNLNINLPSVTPQDRADIMFGCELGIDAIAASFIRDGKAVEEIRHICIEMGTPDVLIFPKIESALGVKNFDEILHVSDGCMVARGDLGVEVPAAQVPHIQKTIIKKCKQHYKPVITATQMLDSMQRNPRPTRAEVNDVANAIYDGTDCVMLSGETAAGKYPIEAVKTMSEICKETEKYLPERKEYHDRGGVRNVNGATGFAALEMADRVNAKCILAPTNSGRSARLISTFRPRMPLFATSPREQTIRRTCFYWGVYAYRTTEQGSLSSTLYDALLTAKRNGLVETGDIVVITAGDPQTSPRLGDYTTSTNMAMVAPVQ